MPDRLESNVANTVDSIALLLRRQFGLEKKQQRDNRKEAEQDLIKMQEKISWKVNQKIRRLV